jgi:hypothetical protein
MWSRVFRFVMAWLQEQVGIVCVCHVPGWFKKDTIAVFGRSQSPVSPAAGRPRGSFRAWSRARGGLRLGRDDAEYRVAGTWRMKSPAARTNNGFM